MRTIGYPIFLTAKAQQDTVLYQRDSAIIIDADPTTVFFQQGERVTKPGKTLLILTSQKTITLAAWLKSNTKQYSDNTLADLDNDGKKELLVSNFTGGAHCCDELYIFKNVGINKYQQAATFFAGHVIITPEKEFIYNFNEQFGYFFSCYACSFTDSSDEAPVKINSINLKYNKGKMVVVTGDRELRNTITDNLAKLGEQPFEKLPDDMAQDNGLRKEIAINLAVFYYSFGKNWAATQTLFNKYYQHPDTSKMWAAFVKQIQKIKKTNSF